MRIALSKGSGSPKYELYGKWLQAADPHVEIVDLFGLTPEAAIEAVHTCSGLVLTGGEDVDPVRYGEPEKRTLCGTISAERDELELAVAKEAIEANLPVLGICRGLQVLNVLYGGTLIADIPHDGYLEHRSFKDADGHSSVDTMHEVEAEPGSLIKRICKQAEGVINSAHHQAIERMATMFAPAAQSLDGIVEAIEWGDASLGGKPFLLAVQWHPERLSSDSPFSKPISQHFVYEVAAYAALLK